MVLKGVILCFIFSVLSVALKESSVIIVRPPDGGTEVKINSTTFKKIGSKYYHIVQQKLSWDKAYLTCRSQGTLLASINNYWEMKALSKYLSNELFCENFWVSGRLLSTKRGFYWYGTGKAFDYTDWVAEEPDDQDFNKPCVLLKREWNDYRMSKAECMETANYICEVKTFALLMF